MQGYHREERVLDVALNALLQRVVDIKNSLQQLLLKIEQQGQNSDWPQYLESFSVISAQIYTLLKLLKNEKTPILRSYLTLPLHLNAEPDDQLLRITEQRVPAFSHDFVPNLLRTKPEPEMEQKINTFELKMSQVNGDTAMKHINGHNKVTKHIIDIVSKARDDWETETATRAAHQQTCSVNETQVLVAAVGTGKGIRVVPGRIPQAGPSPTIPQQQTGPPNKAPSSIKTTIRAGVQTHPYGSK